MVDSITLTKVLNKALEFICLDKSVDLYGKEIKFSNIVEQVPALIKLYDRYVKRLISREQIEELRRKTDESLEEIRSLTSNGQELLLQREYTIQLTREIIDKLQQTNKNVLIAKLSSGVSGFTGTGMAITGLALAPVTAGATLGVTAAGIGVCAAAAVTGTGANAVRAIKEKSGLSDINEAIKMEQEVAVAMSESMKKFKECTEEIGDFLEGIIGQVVDMKIELEKRIDQKPTFVVVSDSLRSLADAISCLKLDQIVGSTGSAGPAAARLVTTAAKPFASYGLLAVGAIGDLAIIIDNAIELHKGSPSRAAKLIEEKAMKPLLDNRRTIEMFLRHINTEVRV